MSSTLLQLNTTELAKALESGIHRVMLEQETLNSINVFPVADADTGTNLSMSLEPVLATLSLTDKTHIGTFLADVADTLLDSARGNSGAIIAEFFQGMSDSAANECEFTTQSFAQAINKGSKYAYDAVDRPCEGTILSVIDAFSCSLNDQASSSMNISIPICIAKATEVAQSTLIDTTNKLEVLKKAGVVDAGAKGFVLLIEGVSNYLVDRQPTKQPEHLNTSNNINRIRIQENSENAEFRFCVECIVNGKDISRRKLREDLMTLGNSLVLAGNNRKTKVHIHVNEPDVVFTAAGIHGKVTGIKADDMHQQQKTAHNRIGKFAVITDSAADITKEDMERFDIHTVPCRIQFGNKGYLDKVNITPEEFYEELEKNPIHPTTSQPSPGDFRRQYEYLASHFPAVISVNLTPKLSGTFQAAQSAAKRTKASGKVHVFNSQNASLGQGQLVTFTAECSKAGLDVTTTLAALDEMVASTTTFALIQDMSAAVRGGRIAPLWGKIVNWLKITPIISIKTPGTITGDGFLTGRNKLPYKFAKHLAKKYNNKTNLHLALGHAMCIDEAKKLEAALVSQMPNIKRITITELGTALGVHAGLGSLVVSVQEYRNPRQFV